MARILPFDLETLRARMRPAWSSMQSLRQGLINLALPPKCIRCKDDLSAHAKLFLCLKCIQTVAPELGACCNRCGALLPEEVIPAERCPACKDFSLKFDAVFPLGCYQGELRELVLKTKRLSHEAISLTIGRLMVLRLAEKIADFRPDAVLPIPMHWIKLLFRGVNSAEILAGCLEKKLGVPVRRSLVRIRKTDPQKDFLPRDRFRNIRGAFRLRRRDEKRWQGKRLLLVDDILTTGATCSEAARLLKQAGAAAVAVAVAARADGS